MVSGNQLQRLCILVCMALLAVSSCQAGSGSDTRPLDKRVEATVYPVWFSGVKGTPSAHGGTSEMVIRIEPNTSRQPAVAMLEQMPAGIGRQWQTAAWLGAFNASQALGLSINQHEFYVRVKGYQNVDGPSAGMLMTATMAALIRGDKIDPKATMTGTINPDGSAGPVGGIPQKIRGAKKRGMEKFGYPLGCRMAQDLRTLKTVDMEALGKSLGVKTVELHDLWEAYTFLTGKKLPRTKPLAASAMVLDKSIAAGLKKLISGWETDISKQDALIRQRVSNFKSIATNLPGVMQTLHAEYKQAADWKKQAQAFADQGNLPMAYKRSTQSALMLRMLADTLDVFEPLIKLDVNTVGKKLGKLQQVQQKVEKLWQDLGKLYAGKTIGGKINAVMGLTTHAMTVGYVRLARQNIGKVRKLVALAKKKPELVSKPAFMVELIRNMSLPFTYYAAADTQVRVTREMMMLGTGQGPVPKNGFTDIGSLANAYSAVASAGLEYFDSIITSSISQGRGWSRERATAFLEEKEVNYPLLRYASILSRMAHKALKDQTMVPIVRLAFGVYGYLTAATLINKFYVLGAQPDRQGNLIIKGKSRLAHQLKLGRVRALEAAARCKSRLGFIPMAGVRYFSLADSLQKGDAWDQLQALEMYWYTAFCCDFATHLAK